ncbi:paraplegin-like [Rhopilema esculentum]|uniref:paraplegin-like n=1 Tax=Rhopilema esculentum TaxID=499914 RepID=UPI0031DDD914
MNLLLKKPSSLVVHLKWISDPYRYHFLAKNCLYNLLLSRSCRRKTHGWKLAQKFNDLSESRKPFLNCARTCRMGTNLEFKTVRGRSKRYHRNEVRFSSQMVLASSPKGEEEEQSSHNSQSKDQQRSPDEDPSPFNWGRLLILGGVVALYIFTASIDPVPESSWSVFYREMLSTGEVQKLEVASSGEKVFVYLQNGAIVSGREIFGPGPHYSFSVSSTDSFEEKFEDVQKELGIDPKDYIPVVYQRENELFNTVLVTAATLAIMGGLLYFLLGRGSASAGRSGISGNPFGSYIKAKATVIEPGTKKDLGFKDVAGMNEAKEEIMEFVDYLKNPKRFTDLGAKIPKGALLVGPPGTGKTLLAKAVATEAAVPFITMAGSDFVEMFAGVGSARVRDLFAQARKRPACIVYIDEIDAIGKSRRSTINTGGNSEQENTLNQLLVEMDGINTTEGVVILASTNRPDILDQALLRPGRFDRLINIDLPTLPERKDIFKLYLKKLRLEKPTSCYAKRLAELTPGKSGADIANICNEAALHAARFNKKNISQTNFDYAVERIIAGMEKKSNPVSPEERKIIAYHEAGHAVVGWMLKHTEPILKVSVAPRTNSVLGYTQHLPLDIKLFTTEQLFDRMCMALGGRVAEALTFQRITTGAEDDLRKVTEMAYKQIVTFGMNSRIGPISFPLKKNTDYGKKPYSDKLARMIDEEASSLVKVAYEKTEEIIKRNEEMLEELAAKLLSKEILNYDDLVAILGESPHGDKRETFANKLSQDDAKN